MTVAPAIVARQESIQDVEQVLFGAGAQLHDQQTGRGMWQEDDEQAVVAAVDEPPAFIGEVDQPALRAGSNGQRTRLHRADANRQGKMLRSASRIRPSPPIAGADS